MGRGSIRESRWHELERAGHVPGRWHLGVAIIEGEADIVLTEHLLVPPEERQAQRPLYRSIVRSIERPDHNIDVVADRLAVLTEEMAIEDPSICIHPDGLGTALWTTLVSEKQLMRVPAYSEIQATRTPYAGRLPVTSDLRGKQQQPWLDRLYDRRRLGLLKVDAGIRQRVALEKALMTYDREARDDRQMPPLVGALALSVWGYATGRPPRVIGRDGRTYIDRVAAQQHGAHVW